MSALSQIIERVRGADVERALGLRPNYPGLTLGVDGKQAALVRIKPGRSATLEAYRSREFDHAMPQSLFDSDQRIDVEGLGKSFSELMQQTGSKPGKTSLVIPDNLAKISLIRLPERPASATQLDQLVRAQMRRAVPFRLEDARLSYQLLPGKESGVVLLVVLVRRALVEQLEAAAESAGARVGLIDISTPNLINLCRPRIDEVGDDADVAVLNSTPSYFSLAILRAGQLIFYRCKSYAIADEHIAGNGLLVRELAHSLNYYGEKLQGEGVGTLCVRSVGAPVDELSERLSSLPFGRIEPLRVRELLAANGSLADEDAQRIAPLIGAALGRR